MPVRSRQSSHRKSASASPLHLSLALALALLAIRAAWQAYRPDLLTRQEKAEQLAGTLDASHALGQSFVAARDHLTAVGLFFRMAPGAPELDADVTLHLRESPSASTDLASASLPLGAIRPGAETVFTFRPQSLPGRELFILVETDAPPEQISLLSSRADARFDGVLYVDGQPAAGDLAFRTYASLNPLALWSDLIASSARLGGMLTMLLIFVLLGGSLLALLSVRWPGGAGEWLALAAIGGLGLPPILFAICSPLGVRLPLPALRAFGIGILLLAAAKTLLQERRRLAGWVQGCWRERRVLPSGPGRITIGQLCPASMLAALFLLALFTRVLQIQDVYAPLWIDGLTHARTIQEISRIGGLEAGTLYHTGFHANVVFLQAFLPMPTAEMMLQYGQVVSLLGGLGLYILAQRLFTAWKLPAPMLAALACAAAFWFFARFPAYLVNWGRYPLMQGALLLPVALAVALQAYEQRKASAYALAACLLAGLFLSHYGTITLYANFLLAWFGLLAWQNKTLSLAGLRQAVGRLARQQQAWLAAGGAVAALLLIGWRFRGLFTDGTLQSIIQQSRQNVQDLDYAQILHISLQGGGLWLACAGLMGLLWAGWKHRPALYVLLGWVIAQAVFIAVQAPFLGQAIASYTNLLQLLSLPLALFVGLLGHELSIAPRQGSRSAADGVLAWTALLGLALAGSLTQVGMINPATNLYTPADQRAAEWIAENASPQATFLVNSNYWGAGRQAVVSSDGGGWIEIVTGRQVEFLREETDQAGLEQFAREHRIAYVYLGLFPGFLDQLFLLDGDETVLPGCRLIYHQDGIRIYQREDP